MNLILYPLAAIILPFVIACEILIILAGIVLLAVIATTADALSSMRDKAASVVRRI